MNAELALLTYYNNSGQSQPEIAAKLNVSQSTIHNWLSGKRKIPLEYYYSIATLCDIDLAQLMPDEWNGIFNVKKEKEGRGRDML